MTDETIRRGEVWTADFGSDPEDPEQAFRRPALIVSDNRLHHPRLRMVVVIPGTSKIRRLPLHVEVRPDAVNGLTVATAFQVEQIRAVSVNRLIERLGFLEPMLCQTVDETLRSVLALNPEW